MMAAAIGGISRDIFTPTAASLVHRAHIARTISPLKPLKPKLPFWKLAAHRIPTKWNLYRGLLRESPSEDMAYSYVIREV